MAARSCVTSTEVSAANLCRRRPIERTRTESAVGRSRGPSSAVVQCCRTVPAPCPGTRSRLAPRVARCRNPVDHHPTLDSTRCCSGRSVSIQRHTTSQLCVRHPPHRTLPISYHYLYVKPAKPISNADPDLDPNRNLIFLANFSEDR